MRRMAFSLSKDDIDELLYLARVGETEDLTSFMQELCQKIADPQQSLLHQLVELARESESGNSVMHMAAANGHHALLRSLLNTVEINSRSRLLRMQNKAGNTPLHWAALNGHLDCVKLLLEAGADPTIKNLAGHDPMYEAEMADRKDVVEWVLKEGAPQLEAGIGTEGKDEAEELDGKVHGEVVCEAETRIDEGVAQMSSEKDRCRE